MEEIEEELKKRNDRPAKAIEAHKRHQIKAKKFIDESEASFVIVKIIPGGSEVMLAISGNEGEVVTLAQATNKASREVLAVVLDHDSPKHHTHDHNEKED